MDNPFLMAITSGGYFGFCKVMISNLSNSANISGTSYVGGIVGYSENGNFQKCSNLAEVSSSDVDGYAGGICGFSEGSTATHMNCSNKGSISGDGFVGGLFGRIGVLIKLWSKLG